MKKKNQIHPIAIAVLVLLLVAAMPWLFPLKDQSEKFREPASEKPHSAPIETDEAEEAVAQDVQKKKVSLDDWMSDQALRVGQPDENPSATLEQMKEKAQSLAPRDLQDLEKMALNSDEAGDRRFLAVEMLVMNPRLESAESLGRILMSPEPSRTSEHALETVLRARAIEGLGLHPRKEAAKILRQSLYRVSDRSLVDRGERALLARKGSVPSPEEQDRKALRSVLNRVK